MSYPSPMTYEWDFGSREEDWMKGPMKKAPPTTSRWQCGNPKKRKKLVHEFVRVTGVHGISYMNSGKKVSKGIRNFYRVLFWVCFLLVTATLATLIQETCSSESSYVNSINKATATGIEEDPDYFPTYPRITICRRPFYKTDQNDSYVQLLRYAALAVGFPYSSLTPEELSHLTKINLHGHLSNFSTIYPKAAEFNQSLHQLRHRFQGLKKEHKNLDVKRIIERSAVECDKMFISCVILVYSLQCCDVFRLVLTNMGPCYTLVNTKTIEQVLHTLPIEFSFNIDLVSPAQINRSLEVGFHVFLNDFLVDTFEFSPFEGQKVVPGLITTVTAQLMKADRTALHTSWHGLSQRCPKLPYQKGVERFSNRACQSYFVYEVLKNNCHCQSILSRETVPGLRFCDPADQYHCMLSVGLKSNLTGLQRVCRRPCITYSFRSDASYIGLGSQNVSRVEIMYDSKQFIFHEYRTTTISSFLSQIGGALGLYLGASIITVVEIFVFTVSWVWHACAPARTRVRLSPEHPYTQ